MLDNEREFERFKHHCYLNKINPNPRNAFDWAWQARANLIPDGTMTVPIEPTEELITNMAMAYERSPGNDLIAPMEDAYDALIQFVTMPHEPIKTNDKEMFYAPPNGI